MESSQVRKARKTSQINKDSQKKDVTQVEGDPTREVEVEEEARKLAIDVTNVTS